MIKETIELYRDHQLLAVIRQDDKFPEGILPNCTHMLIRTEMTKEEFERTYALRGGGVLIQKAPNIDDVRRLYECGREEVLNDLMSRANTEKSEKKTKFLKNYAKDYVIKILPL